MCWIKPKSSFWSDSQALGRKCLRLSLALHRHCLSEAEGPLALPSLTWLSQPTHDMGSSPCHVHFKSPFFSSCTRKSYWALMTTKCNELRSKENAIYLSSPGTILHTGPCDHKYLPSKLHIINKNANTQPWWHLSRHLQLPPELHSHMYTCSKPGVCGSSFSGFPLFQSLRYSEIRCSIINIVLSLLFKDVKFQIHRYILDI